MSNSSITLKVTVLSALLLGSGICFAQGRPGGGAASRQGQSRITSGSRIQDQLSTRSTDQLRDRTQDRLHDKQQDRLHDQDRLRDRDQDRIYAASLMSAAEQKQYQDRLHLLASPQERVQYRMQQQHEMQQRAEQRGVTLRPAPTLGQVRAEEQQRQREREQIYGYSMMSPAEVGHYEQQLRSAQTEQQRERIRTEHRQAMQARARARGEAAPQ